MSNPAPDQVTRDDTLLRDRLAVDRTRLANERTLLAYVRTSLAFLIVGGSLLKFFASVAAEVTGVVFLAAGAIVGVVGVWRFQSLRNRLH